jgi:hypothetical protein
VNHDGDLVDTAEMYLRTVLELEEEGVVALRARIAERLGNTASSVSQEVTRMVRAGELTLTLTAESRDARPLSGGCASTGWPNACSPMSSAWNGSSFTRRPAAWST